MNYKFVTREEIDDAFRTDDNEECILKSDVLLQRLFAERHAYREVAIKYESLIPELGLRGIENQEKIDAEAARILEGGK